jgi:hypothetical protein
VLGSNYFSSLRTGLVNTGLIDKGAPGMAGRGVSVDEGIRNTMFLGTANEAAGITGAYFHDSGVRIPLPICFSESRDH